MALSDQLVDLASRTKHLEDTAKATDERNRARLEKDREELHANVETEAQKLQESADRTDAEARSWWADVTRRIEQRRAELRGRIEHRKAEHQLDRAKRNADDAENYASDMLSLATYVVDVAEYAVVDASIARTEADELATRT